MPGEIVLFGLLQITSPPRRAAPPTIEKGENMRTTESIFAGLLALAAIAPPPAAAAPITINGITVSDQNLFADNKGINDVGIASGFELRFGVNIAGGSAGYSGAGIFTPAPGSTSPPLTQTLSPCGPNSANEEFCAGHTKFAAAKLDGSWQFEVESPSGTTATFGLPSAAPIPTTSVPFPGSVTITNSASGTNPTISWALPGAASPGGPSYTPDAFRINIYDRSTPPLSNGVNNAIFSHILASTATSYVVPTGVGLISGDKYTIEFQLITTRDGGSNPSNSNADILTRSSSYWDFTPEPSSVAPGAIALAMVDGATGVYHFDVGSVGPSSVTYIDPAVAVG